MQICPRLTAGDYLELTVFLNPSFCALYPLSCCITVVLKSVQAAQCAQLGGDHHKALYVLMKVYITSMKSRAIACYENVILHYVCLEYATLGRFHNQSNRGLLSLSHEHNIFTRFQLVLGDDGVRCTCKLSRCINN